MQVNVTITIPALLPGQSSDQMELVVTGVYSKPSLSALLSPVVASGEKGTLQLGPVIPNDDWMFRCYGYDRSEAQVSSEPTYALRLLISEPGRVTRRGSTVTIVCRAQWGFESFLLEKCSAGSYTLVQEVGNTATSNNVARFYLTLMNTGRYACIYQKWSTWSSRSEILELEVTSTDVTQTSMLPASTTPVDDSHLATPGLKAEHLYLLIGASVGILLLLLLLLLFCLRRRRQNKQGPPRQQDQRQRSQERCSLAGVSLGRTADQAAADRPLPRGRQQGPSTPLQGPQEVTYAQLDHRALTLRGAPEVSPQSTVESSTYAVLAHQRPSPRGPCT
ncbi:leukocyte-associated immunoglobulin-like receptor 1 [Octodon degus]|uniref:Leukocyte-associated immunoglobulin-like receptor 1 n=1 Tax=Octodon degus TaxID=10160 RepID=A0A6P6DX28_OCTDE|nr:leukocyte-associated immunoglobulin-like receptor 1 [Octodon degus]